MNKNTLSRHRWPGLLVLALIGLLLGGCFHQAQQTGPNDDTGELNISLTDAEGDFLRYAVTLESIRLTHSDGTEVETLPQNTQVDFAQYVDMSEFLTAAQIPNGVYVQARLRLDYNDADIQVEDADGNAVAVERIEDIDGNPITTLEVKVALEDRDRLRIVPGIPALLSLDFDLASSNQVIFEDTGPRLVVEPVLIAELNPEKPKPHRVRGPLQGVDVDNGRFSVLLRPFVQRLDQQQDHFGRLQVETASDTVYDIDGAGYAGSEGLRALAALPAFSAVVAIGDVGFNPRRFVAREVYAGSSVPGGSLDVVRGHVIARQGDRLTVKGATLIRAGGSVVFNDRVDITLADSTVVRREGRTESQGPDAVSVGQKVMVFGSLTDEQAGRLQMDASNGRIRLLTTRLRGLAVALDTSDPVAPLTLELQAIDRRGVALFDFSGTGATETEDADPANYQVATGDLDLDGLELGSPLLAFGFVTPFGSAPADFEARTVAEVSAAPAVMTINWQPPSANAISRLDDSGITFDLGEAGRLQQVVRNGVRTALAGLAAAPRIEPAADSGVYVIQQNGSRQLFTRFDAFVAELQARLDAGALLAHVSANGRFDDTAATLAARRLRLRLR